MATKHYSRFVPQTLAFPCQGDSSHPPELDKAQNTVWEAVCLLLAN